MDKKNVIIVIVLIIVAIVLAIVAGQVTFNLTKKDKETSSNVANETSNSTIVAQYTMDKETQYSIVPENTVDEGNNTITEQKSGTNTVPSSTIYETNPDLGATDRKQEAIELVKKEWGEDNTVTFRCDYVTESGEYRIAVISTETASVKNYFTVNLENKTVEVEY